MHVLHSCDNPPCCNPSHLSLGTPADNMLDMARKGRACVGERHHCAKLAPADVLCIRRSLENGIHPRTLARLFGVGRSAILDSGRGKTWKSINQRNAS